MAEHRGIDHTFTDARHTELVWLPIAIAKGICCIHRDVPTSSTPSYKGLYVDEYQDCTSEQHALVMKLARELPCRILGDPLQGIFDFGEQIIDWKRDVAGMCSVLGTLQTPERWYRDGTPTIGCREAPSMRHTF